MARVSVIPARDDLPRGGAARAVAGLTAAIALHSLNRALSQPSCAHGGDPTKATAQNEFIYCITGQVLRMQPVGDIWDFTGLTPVPPGSFQQYFLLVDRDENARVQEAVASPFSDLVVLGNLSPNPYEATVEMLNAAPTGWAVAGSVGIHVAAASTTPFTPGVDALDVGAVLDGCDFIDGFNGTILLPAVGTGSSDVAQPVLV